MCEYCGCRQIEPIAQLMDEHLSLLELSGDIRRAVARADRATAYALLRQLQQQLHPHVRREERGVFAAMKNQGEFVDAIVDLEQEHLDFDDALAALDPSAGDYDSAVTNLLSDLSEHIDKENLGIFPLAVVSLNAAGWNTVTGAHDEDRSPTHMHNG